MTTQEKHIRRTNNASSRQRRGSSSPALLVGCNTSNSRERCDRAVAFQTFSLTKVAWGLPSNKLDSWRVPLESEYPQRHGVFRPTSSTHGEYSEQLRTNFNKRVRQVATCCIGPSVARKKNQEKACHTTVGNTAKIRLSQPVGTGKNKPEASQPTQKG